MATLLTKANLYDDADLRKKVSQAMREHAFSLAQQILAGTLYPDDAAKRSRVNEWVNRVFQGSGQVLNEIMSVCSGNQTIIDKVTADPQQDADSDIGWVVAAFAETFAFRIQ